MRLSNSKVKTWRRCPKQYEFKYVMGLRKRTTTLPLARGDWIHQMLQCHYDGEGWQQRWKELTIGFENMFDEEKEELGDLPGETKRIMQSYLHRYKREDSQMRVVDSELNEIIKINDDLNFEFIIDLIVEEHDGLWLWDHKTVKTFMDSDFMLLDAQLARYFYCAEKMGYTPLRGIIFNEIRTKPPSVPELLKSGGLSKRQNIDTDVLTYRRAIRDAGLDEADYADILQTIARKGDTFFRRTRLPKDRPLTKRLMRELVWSAREIRAAEAREQFPRTPDKSCTWGCDFTDICIAELFGGDIDSMIKSNFERRVRP